MEIIQSISFTLQNLFPKLAELAQTAPVPEQYSFLVPIAAVGLIILCCLKVLSNIAKIIILVIAILLMLYFFLGVQVDPSIPIYLSYI